MLHLCAILLVVVLEVNKSLLRIFETAQWVVTNYMASVSCMSVLFTK